MKKEYLHYKDIKKPFSKWDLIVLGVVILLVVALLLVIFIPKQSPEYVCIYREGKLVKKVMLSSRDNSEVVEVSGLRILIESDGVSVIQSDCDDHACQKTGKITKKGECVVCVPEMVTIELS